MPASPAVARRSSRVIRGGAGRAPTAETEAGSCDMGIGRGGRAADEQDEKRLEANCELAV